MSTLSYSIYQLDHGVTKGTTDEIHILDKDHPFVILPDHGPIICCMTKGKIKIQVEETFKEYSYTEGFLRFEKNTCRIHLKEG